MMGLDGDQIWANLVWSLPAPPSELSADYNVDDADGG